MTTSSPVFSSPAPTSAWTNAARDGDRLVGLWVLACAVMVFVMVVLGGLTRLTGSGLSMVEWQPLTLLPPMTEAAWLAEFEKYRQFPEYMEVNRGMSLEEFKGIFWLEYIHRLWGRLIGVVFLVPFVWFLVRRRLSRPMAWRLAVLFALGGLQGLMGWIMVKSGLSGEPRVSPYLLTLHLGLALVIFGALLWNAFLLLAPAVKRPWQREAARLASRARGLLVLVTVTILSGGFVAGTKAGHTYNTFPLMDGRLIPEGLFALSPWYRNPFENVTMVQFDHRLLAVATLVAVLWVWAGLRGRLEGAARLALDGTAVMVLVQVGLGIATLLLAVPIALGALHQAGALVLFALLLWLAYAAGFQGSGTREQVDRA